MSTDDKQQETVPKQQEPIIITMDLNREEFKSGPLKLLADIHSKCLLAFKISSISYEDLSRFKAIQRQVKRRIVLYQTNGAVDDVSIVHEGDEIFDEYTAQVDQYFKTRSDDFLFSEANRMLKKYNN